MASLASYLRFFVRATVAVRGIEAHEPRLRELNLWYRNNVADLDIATRVFFEAIETQGVMVVNATSADPGLPGVTPIPVDSNHYDVCRPLSRDDVRYAQTLKFVNDRLPRGVEIISEPLPDRISPLRQRLLLAHSGRDLRRLLHETEQVIADLPHYRDAKQLRDDIQMALRYEEAPPAPRRARYRFSPITPLIGLVGLGVLLYWLYRLIAWVSGW